MKPTPLESAIELVTAGFRVVALHHPIATGAAPKCSCRKGAKCAHIGKHPRYDPRLLKRGAHSASCDLELIRAWWQKWPLANIGVAVGPAAGIMVIDVDPRNGGNTGFEILEAECGRLPDTITAHTGGGGRHYFLRHPQREVCGTPASGVDVIASDGSLVVVEPSLHRTGRRYVWEASSSFTMVRAAELPDRWLSRLSVGPVPRIEGVAGTAVTSGTAVTLGTAGTSSDGGGGGSPSRPLIVPTSISIDTLIERTCPTGPGQHDRCNNDFARGLKFNAGIHSLEEAQRHFEVWFERARPHIKEENYDLALYKFERAFNGARFPLDCANLAESAFNASLTRPPPGCAARFKSGQTHQLVGLVREMHERFGSPFKLSTHQIGSLLSCAPKVAWSLMQRLVEKQVLRCEDPGRSGKKGGVAASWTYLGD